MMTKELNSAGREGDIELVYQLLSDMVFIETHKVMIELCVVGAQSQQKELLELLCKNYRREASNALQYCVREGDLQSVKMLQNFCTLLNYETLSAACEGGNLEMVEYLLSQGSKKTSTALNSAVKKQSAEIISLVMSPELVGQDTLYLGALELNANMFQLIDVIEKPNEFYFMLLNDCAEYIKPDTAEYLVRKLGTANDVCVNTFIGYERLDVLETLFRAGLADVSKALRLNAAKSERVTTFLKAYEEKEKLSCIESGGKSVVSKL